MNISLKTGRFVFKLCAGLGLVYFIYLFVRMGPAQIWVHISRMGWAGLFVLMALRLIYWVIRSFAWSLVLRAHTDAYYLSRLFSARLAGHAIAYLTPAAKVGGEAVRFWMVTDVDKKQLFSSVVVDKSIELLATFLLFALAVLTAAFMNLLSGPKLWIFLLLLAVSLLSLWWFFKKQKQGLLVWLLQSVGRLGLRFKKLGDQRENVAETDAHIMRIYRERRPVIIAAACLYGLLVLIWTVEIHITFLLLGTPDITLLKSFFVVSLGSLAHMLPALPASLGIYEITYVSLFSLLGIGLGQGMGLILTRRILGLIWAGIGLVFFWIRAKKSGSLPLSRTS